MDDVSAGAELKKARNAAGLTLDQLAAAVGVTQSAVTQWEAGRVAPRLQKAIALDDALQAGGAILTAFGYARPVSQRDEVAELQAQVAQLSADLDAVWEQIEALGGAVVRARPRREPVEQRST